MSISSYLAKEPIFTISFASHCRAHNDTNYILKVAEYDKRHQKFIPTLREWLADVNILVNISNSRTMLIVNAMGNNEYSGSVDISNCRLVGRRLEKDNNFKLNDGTLIPHSFKFIADNHTCTQHCVV